MMHKVGALGLALALLGCDAGGEAPRTPDTAPLDAATPDTSPLVDAEPPPPDAAPLDAEPPPPDAAPPPPPPPLAAVRLNEVDCRGRDGVELVNIGDAPIDLAGFVLTDDPADPTRGFTLPAGESLAPAGLRATRQAENDEPGFAFGIACGDDAITLLDPLGRALDRVQIPALAPRATWGRLPDGAGDFGLTAPSLGEPNAALGPPAPALFDPLRRTTVEISIPQANVDRLFADPRGEVQARLRVIDADGLSLGWRVVGMHIKGRIGSARDLNGKPGLRIDLNAVSEDGEIDGLENLTLNNMVQDPSFVHEWATYALFRALGLPAPRVGFTWVRINDQDYGLYAQIETYDDVFVGQHLPPTAHMYEGLYGQDFDLGVESQIEVEEGDPNDLSDFNTLREALDRVEAEGADTLLETTGALVDWPQVVRFFAVEIYVGHWDGYASTRNNWYAHFDTDGVVRFLPWGVDQTWGYAHPWHQGGGRLFRLCMQSRACRATFDAALGEVAAAQDAIGLPDATGAVMRALWPAIERDPRREFDLPTVEYLQAETLAFMRSRRDEARAVVECVAAADDPDGDGWICDADCAPDQASVYPGAPEVCGDGLDNDCNGRLDDAPECPDCVERLRGSHRYLFCPYPRDFGAAAARCAEYGAEPVSIGGAAENQWVWESAFSVAYQWWWIGASASPDSPDTPFTWANGAPLEFVAWSEGQPDRAGGVERCAHFWEWAPQWNDLDCSAALGTICEAPCAPGTDADGDGYDACSADCDDSDPAVSPGAAEVCADGVDQDCDGVPDDGPGCDCVEVLRGPQRYLLCGRARGWDDAQAQCAELGMGLALMDTPGESIWLSAQRDAWGLGSLWIGHNDREVEGEFRGWDGAPRPGRWADGEPNNYAGEEHCAELSGGGLWNDLPCGAALASACEALCAPGEDDADRDGASRCGPDCDDGDRRVRPGGREVCGDGIDDDCSGVADDGPQCP